MIVQMWKINENDWINANEKILLWDGSFYDRLKLHEFSKT